MTGYYSGQFGSLPPITPPKRNIFVSYHHANDQWWYNSFSNTFATQLNLFRDNSLDRVIDSENAQYVDRTIRENFIHGSSITIVLMGTETWKRRWIDWEIHATLDAGHALLGIALPPGYHSIAPNGGVLVPDRFQDNRYTGYAHFIHWPSDYQTLSSAIEYAISLSQVNKANNSREKLMRSHS